MKINEANRLIGVSEYYFSKKLREIEGMNKSGEQVINLGIGNPDLSPPTEVVEELSKWISKSEVHGYQSYKGILEFREAIANWSKRIYNINLDPETEILPLIGAKEGVMHISQAFVNAGDNVLVPNPGYPTYGAVSNLAQAEVLTYNVSNETVINIEEITKLISSKTKIIWVNFPHMPSGIKANVVVLKQLVDLARRESILIVNDNPYSTILSEEYFSIFQIEGAKEVCLELNSLSKSHNMAGWRMGWLAGRKELISSVLKVKSNMDSGMYLPLQKAAIKALQVEDDWIHKLNDVYKERRQIVWNLLDKLNCQYEKDRAGMFIWAKIPETYSSSEQLVEELLSEAKVFIAPGFIFGSNGNDYIRISLCNSVEKLNKALGRINDLKEKSYVE